MSSLQELKNRITGVKSTQKLTRAMRMVAASKFMKARNNVVQARPYSEKLDALSKKILTQASLNDIKSCLAKSTVDKKNLVVVVSSDKGLCGGFNNNIIKEVLAYEKKMKAQNKELLYYFIGTKAFSFLQNKISGQIIGNVSGLSSCKEDLFEKTLAIANEILLMLNQEKFDHCNIIYNSFKSVIVQELTNKKVIPLDLSFTNTEDNSYIEYEPDIETLVDDVLPRNFKMQIYQIILDNLAGEYGARMNAMENATNNASDIIKKLTLLYNRSRQAAITKELIEIISGAEAL